MEETSPSASTSKHEETETHGGKLRHAELELEQGMPASRNEQSDTDSNDTDSDDYDERNSGPLSTLRNEESVTDSNEDDKEPSVPASTLKHEERGMDSSSELSSGDVETEQQEIDKSSGDLPIDVLDVQTCTEEKEEEKEEEKDEGGRDGDTNTQKAQSSPESFAAEPSLPTDEVIEDPMEITPESSDNSKKEVLGGNAGVPVSILQEENMQEMESRPGAFADEQQESTLTIDEDNEGSMAIVFETGDDSKKQVLGDDVGAVISTSEDRNKGDQSVKLQSLEAPLDEENKPSCSQTNVTRDLAPELVELDERNPHDPLKVEDKYVKKGFTCDGNTDEEDEEQLREYWMRTLQTSTSTGEVVEEIVKVLKHHQKTHDLLCPVCGSCVTRRVILRKRKRSSLISVDRWYRDPLDEAEVQEQGSSLELMEAVEEQDTQEFQDTEAFGCLSCFSLFFEKGRRLLNQLQADIGPDTFNCLPFFFPPYPWGMTQMKPKSPGTEEESRGVEVIEESEEPSSTDLRSSFSCGIGSTLLPDYPWGTMPSLSKGEVIQPSNQTDTLPVEQVQDVSQSDEISQPLFRERTCTCGLAPALLPAYPWGYCTKSELSGEQIQGGAISGAVGGQPPLINESTCTCGLAQALLPDYPWGYLSKVEEVAVESPPDVEAVSKDSSTTLQAVSQHEISEELLHLHREGRNCTCGLVPALLPDYPWGYLGASRMQTQIVPQAQTVEETEGKRADDKRSSCDLVSAVLPDYPWGMTTESEEVLEEGPILSDKRKSRHETMQTGSHVHVGSAILPSYPWGVCSQNQTVHDQNGSAPLLQGVPDRDCTCGLGPAMWPKFPWGQTQLTADKQAQTGKQQVKSYIEQETKIEARITSKTDVFTVISSKTTYPGEKPPQNIKTMIPHETSQTIQHVKLDQTVTIVDASVKVEEVSAIKGSSLHSFPSTGYALLDLVEEGVAEKLRPDTKPPTGYEHLEEINEEAEPTGKDATKIPEQPHKKNIKGSKVSFAPTVPDLEDYEQEPPESEIEEDPTSVKYSQLEAKSENIPQPVSEETFHKLGKTRPPVQPGGTKFPSFQRPVGKLDAGDLTTPLLKDSVELEAEKDISVLKPSAGVEEPKSEHWLSIFSVSKPSDEEGITAPLLSTTTGSIEEIEEMKLPVVTEAVIDVPPSDLGGTSLGTATSTAVAVPAKKKEADEWDILKSIVYGGLDISIASLGVTSSAAGGDAITRTVVYMGLATLLSGLIGFYHNVLNLYHYHRDHYTDLVGVSLMLHGTVALISYVVFGLLSPLTYAFSYRETDDRDEKFMLCCGVTIVAVTALALGKAKVSNKRYLRTLSAYLLGGVLAAIIGYLTGEHVAELLEEWGI